MDIEGKDKEEENDYESSVFIGNIPWVVNEEELRSHFKECGKIQNVRIIRDKDTFMSKGFAYIMFSNKDEMKKAIETKNKSLFKVSLSLIDYL